MVTHTSRRTDLGVRRSPPPSKSAPGTLRTAKENVSSKRVNRRPAGYSGGRAELKRSQLTFTVPVFDLAPPGGEDSAFYLKNFLKLILKYDD